MRFIDLFAGLGGFHMALQKLGHTCVFACEIDDTLNTLYASNFDMDVAGDIRKVCSSEVPEHDILCAGFPCQPFSKARKRTGNNDSDLIELYQEIVRIISYRKPQYIILENVPDLIKHNDGKTWSDIKNKLEELGYNVPEPFLVSPHEFGIPQIRRRVYIVGSLNSLDNLVWPTLQSSGSSIKDILEQKPPGAKAISDSVKRCLEIWQEFMNQVPPDESIPHPLWSMEFGATYPYKEQTPHSLGAEALRCSYRGSHGRELSEANTGEEVFDMLPSHARTQQKEFPSWKRNYIEKNRMFYRRHKSWLDAWMEDIKEYPSSFQKLEWNCNERDPRSEDRDITKYIIQIRPSGVRVKRPTTAPSLVAMTATQVPIIGWEDRYMTLEECKRLQSMDSEISLPEAQTKAYSALGNAVNVEVASRVAESLLSCSPPGDSSCASSSE